MGASFSAWSQTPQVQTSSAFIQLMSQLDGTITDVSVPGLESPGREIIGFVAQSRPDLASAWLESGVDLAQDPVGINCTDVPEDFIIDDYGDYWVYRDERTLGCSWKNQPFALKIGVLVEEKGGISTWTGTELLSNE